jgi:hypothetical protein
LLTLAIVQMLGCQDIPQNRRYEFRDDKEGHVIRLNTSTGEATSTDGGTPYQLLAPEDTSTQKLLGTEELSKVTGNGGCDLNHESFEGRLYNGSNLVLRSISVVITNKKFLSPDEVAWKRQFMVRDVYVRPLEVKRFVIPLAGVESTSCDWMIDHAWGSPWPPTTSWWDRF